MRTIKPGQAQVGDVIAGPLVNEDGRTLLPKGARLSAAVLSRLEGWGIHELCIEGDDPEDADSEDADPEDEGSSGLLEALEHRFSEWEGEQTMVGIRAVARRHLEGLRGKR